MTPEQFRELIMPVIAHIGSRPLDLALHVDLNTTFPAGGPVYQSIFEACRGAIEAGWMCNREAGGVKFGRVMKPSPETNQYSVDVVDMENVKGPHHRHPNGEIDLIMPLTPEAQFDGVGPGWLVYMPGTAHFPTVSSGRALVLYLLPGGAIEFTPPAAAA